MVCNNCGTENKKEALICIRCGSKLEGDGYEKVIKSIDSSGEYLNKLESEKKPKAYVNEKKLRKSIKKDSKKKPKGTLMVGIFLICAIQILISAIIFSSDINTGLESYQYIIGIVLIVLSIVVYLAFNFGINGLALKINRDQPYESVQILTLPFKNLKKIIFLGIFMLVISVLAFIGLNIPVISSILFFIYLPITVYFYPTIDTMKIMCSDCEYEFNGLFSLFLDANDLVHRRRVEYYGMILSFVGWGLISILTCGILLIWLFPYMALSKTNMYRRWLYEVEYEESKCLSNGLVIFFSSIIIYVVISALAFFFLITLIRAVFGPL